MSLPENLQKGDSLVLVSDDRDRRARPVVVSRVGRTWVYICYEGDTHESPDQFSRTNGVSKENHGWARYLVTPEQYEEMTERKQLLADLKTAGVEIEHGRKESVPLAKLRGLLAVMKED